MAEKRYQIFISSTFEDLKEERQSAIRAVLEMDHIPAGMELFPATDDAAWDLIKYVIRDSDYYVVIVGGRYGSLDTDGLSYTEKEYDFSTSLGIPVVPLLHSNPDNLPRTKTETDSGAWEKLQEFRVKVESNHTCKYWASAEDLEAKLILGLTATIKRHPGIGWIRADKATSKETLQKLEEARERISELEKNLKDFATGPPPGSENLASGDEKLTINYQYRKESYNSPYTKGVIEITWNDILTILGPHMLREAPEGRLVNILSSYIISSENLEVYMNRVEINDNDFQAIKVQLIALGLMQKSTEKHTASDTATYWSLTPFGEASIVKLRAIKSNPTKDFESKDE